MKKMTENVHYHTGHLFAEKSHYSLDRPSSHWGLFQFQLELWFHHIPIGFLLESSEYQPGEKFSFPVSNDFEQTTLLRSK